MLHTTLSSYNNNREANIETNYSICYTLHYLHNNNREASIEIICLYGKVEIGWKIMGLEIAWPAVYRNLWNILRG